MNNRNMVWAVALGLLSLPMVFAVVLPTLTKIPAITTFTDTGASTQPIGLAADGLGNVYISDEVRHVIRKVDAAGVMTTVAGIDGAAAYSGDGAAASAAHLNAPRDVAVDGAGNLYIADTGNNAIRVVNTQASGNLTVFGITIAPGQIKTVAGNGTAGFTSAQLSFPNCIALDGTGTMYIADASNNAIRKVASNGTMTTVVNLAGTAGLSGNGAAATAAQLNFPTSVALDAKGNLYIGDTGNTKIRVVNNQAGSIVVFGVTIGSGHIATVQNSDSDNIVVNAAGDLYIALGYAHKVYFVSVLTGVISDFAGTGGSGTSGDGAAATAALIVDPVGLTLDPYGNLYIAAPTHPENR